MDIKRIIGLACALCVLGSFGNAECVNNGEEDKLEAPAAKRGRVSPEIEDLTANAATGYAQAQFELGFCYEHGIGVARDTAQALYWYQMAAEQGHTYAQQARDRLTI